MTDYDSRQTAAAVKLQRLVDEQAAKKESPYTVYETNEGGNEAFYSVDIQESSSTAALSQEAVQALSSVLI